MKTLQNRCVAVLALLGACLLASLPHSGRQGPATHRLAHAAMQALPATMLWVFEREEDLRQLPAGVGVAYVASVVELRGQRATVRLRQHHVALAPHTPRLPVVHVDADFSERAALLAEQRHAVVQQVLHAHARDPHAQAVQLDFEVRRSERGFYRALVHDIRAQLPPHVGLSVTALASWCAGDNWLGELPVDEIVPMAFRMGRDSALLRERLSQSGGFAPAHCQRAIGTATDEPIVGLRSPRTYHFSPRGWRADALPPPAGSLAS